jgi:hypothetical protein
MNWPNSPPKSGLRGERYRYGGARVVVEGHGSVDDISYFRGGGRVQLEDESRRTEIQRNIGLKGRSLLGLAASSRRNGERAGGWSLVKGCARAFQDTRMTHDMNVYELIYTINARC